MTDLEYAVPAGTLKAYLAEPSGTGPFPGVVVIQDALGLSDDIKAQADRFASEGYLAFAPDLYSAGGGLRCVLATLGASRSGKGRAYDDIEAARAWLAGREDCTGRVALIGFCMGGGFAVMCAPRYDFAASSVNYGEVPKDAETALSGSCPIVGSYGKRDKTLRGRADRLERALAALNVPHDVKEYPDAGHSFMNRLKVGPLGPLLPVLGFDFNEEATEDAWRRILAFFDEHVRGDGTGGPAGAGAQPSSA
jgi:carboxymethylenebutenolidase